MLNLLNWNKPLMVNGKVYENSSVAYESLKDFTGEIEVKLNFKEVKQEKPRTEEAATPAKELKSTTIYRFEVKAYMTKKSDPMSSFDFMKKWNNDKPMPMRRMYGEILEETKGMYRVKLHGRAERDASQCSHCMRTLTHPVSMYYGIGPICGGHSHMAPMSVLEKIQDKEELFRTADENLRKVAWEGWIIKSAITGQTPVETVRRQEEVAV